MGNWVLKKTHKSLDFSQMVDWEIELSRKRKKKKKQRQVVDKIKRKIRLRKISEVVQDIRISYEENNHFFFSFFPFFVIGKGSFDGGNWVLKKTHKG